MSWHLALSREHVDERMRRIATPRHLVIYRVTAGELHVLRLLHDAMDLHRQFIPQSDR